MSESYFSKWYEENKQKLSERRKNRYANDPEYAERQREAARRYRARKRAERSKTTSTGANTPDNT